mmetsp:Transcript_884/g.1092  ORF Transcript_884/g.1092 Transcript_884/m.1092 type:complete len:117 (+) Transcript_884:622-972(+)
MSFSQSMTKLISSPSKKKTSETTSSTSPSHPPLPPPPPQPEEDTMIMKTQRLSELCIEIDEEILNEDSDTSHKKLTSKYHRLSLLEGPDSPNTSSSSEKKIGKMVFEMGEENNLNI